MYMYELEVVIKMKDGEPVDYCMNDFGFVEELERHGITPDRCYDITNSVDCKDGSINRHIFYEGIYQSEVTPYLKQYHLALHKKEPRYYSVYTTHNKD